MPDAIRQRSKRLKKVTAEMYDPEPVFVSLVSHGANQRPFKVVKIADFSGDDDKGTEVKDMATATKNAAYQGEGAPLMHIHEIKFSADKFATEGDVKAFLDARGYADDMAVDKDGKDGFVVRGLDADQFDKGGIEEIDVPNEGVVFRVGKPVDPLEVTVENDVKTITSGKDEILPISDDGDGKTAIDDGANVTDPGSADDPDVDTVSKAATVIKKLEDAGVDFGKISARKANMSSVSELGNILVSLYWIVNETEWEEEVFEDAPQGLSTRMKKAAKELINVLAEMMDDNIEQFANAFKKMLEERGALENKNPDAVDPAVDGDEETEVVKAGEGDEPNPATTEEGTGEDPAPIEEPATLTDVIKTMGTLADTVGKLSETVVALQKNNEGSEEAERVDEPIDGGSQTRKGADVDEEPTGTPQPDKAKEQRIDPVFARTIGLQVPRDQ